MSETPSSSWPGRALTCAAKAGGHALLHNIEGALRATGWSEIVARTQTACGHSLLYTGMDNTLGVSRNVGRGFAAYHVRYHTRWIDF